MPALKNLVGHRFGNLVVLERTADRKRGRPRWLCKCDCGGMTNVSSGNLRSEITKSCGCLVGLSGITHGQTYRREYEIWKSMKARCRRPADKSWPKYGGRGIKVCERWDTFENFIADMGTAPDGMSLDRINNDGDYSPENCRWATNAQQARNKSNNSGVEFNGVYKLWAEWAEAPEAAVSQQLLRSRVVVWKWDFEEALRTPPKMRGARNACR